MTCTSAITCIVFSLFWSYLSIINFFYTRYSVFLQAYEMAIFFIYYQYVGHFPLIEFTHIVLTDSKKMYQHHLHVFKSFHSNSFLRMLPFELVFSKLKYCVLHHRSFLQIWKYQVSGDQTPQRLT